MNRRLVLDRWDCIIGVIQCLNDDWENENYLSSTSFRSSVNA